MIKSKVVLVPFPFDDLSTNKARPAVCLTVTTSLIQRELGELSPRMHEEVNKKLRKLFGL